MKFEKIRPGMVLYDRHRERAGNTTMSRLGEWAVRIVGVDSAKRSAVVSWNGNREQVYFESSLEKLKNWSMYGMDVIREEGLVGTRSARKMTKAEIAARDAAARAPGAEEIKVRKP